MIEWILKDWYNGKVKASASLNKRDTFCQNNYGLLSEKACLILYSNENSAEFKWSRRKFQPIKWNGKWSFQIVISGLLFLFFFRFDNAPKATNSQIALSTKIYTFALTENFQDSGRCVYLFILCFYSPFFGGEKSYEIYSAKVNFYSNRP